MKRPTLETVTNLAMVATCLVACTAIFYRSFAAPSPAAAGMPGGPEVGEKVRDVPETSYGKSAYTLLMYLNSNCRFCTDSMPFYEVLSKENPAPGKVRLVVAATEPVDTSRSYLTSHRVTADEIVSVPPGLPTPTLILVDRNGVVQKTWSGRLNNSGQGEVKSTLGGL